jgi:hypothetical protein
MYILITIKNPVYSVKLSDILGLDAHCGLTNVVTDTRLGDDASILEQLNGELLTHPALRNFVDVEDVHKE